jgi:hypothetical protein
MPAGSRRSQGYSRPRMTSPTIVIALYSPLESALRSGNPNIPLVGICVAEQQPEYSPRLTLRRIAATRIFPSLESALRSNNPNIPLYGGVAGEA